MNLRVILSLCGILILTAEGASELQQESRKEEPRRLVVLHQEKIEKFPPVFRRIHPKDSFLVICAESYNVTDWDEGQDMVRMPYTESYILGYSFFYLWHGEEKIPYIFEDGFCLVNGRRIGVSLFRVDMEDIEAPEEIVSVITDPSRLPHLTRLPNLTAVSVYCEKDSDLRDLAEYKELKVLDLSFSQITDAGIKYLEGLDQLRNLWLWGSPITDRALLYISSLRNLRVLELFETSVTDAGLTHTSGLTDLEELDLSVIQITDAGLVSLSGLRNLEVLYLQGTSITDSGLAHLAGLSELRELDVSNTEITDAAIPYIKKLSQLNELDLYETEISEEVRRELQLALPNCLIN